MVEFIPSTGYGPCLCKHGGINKLRACPGIPDVGPWDVIIAFGGSHAIRANDAVTYLGIGVLGFMFKFII